MCIYKAEYKTIDALKLQMLSAFVTALTCHWWAGTAAGGPAVIKAASPTARWSLTSLQ